MLEADEREKLYRGALLERSGGGVFLEQLWEPIRVELGPSPRQAEAENFLESLTRLREQLSQPLWRQRSREFLAELGISAEEFAIDRFRLRGVTPGSQHIEAARAAFYAHRDTWFANPQAQINLWMPLHEVGPENSFGFYPEWFERPAENHSEQFDYDEFLGRGGFQSPQTRAIHPHWLIPELPESQPVSLQAGRLLLFSAAHLHATRPNLSDQTRFSIDLRLVHRGDHQAGRGAPNVDNRCRGCALADYTW